MRSFIICAFFLCGYLNSYSSTISIIIKDQLSKHNFYFWNEVQVKGPDTAFTHKLHYKLKEEILVSKPGNYSFVFTSIFGHKVYKTLKVGNKKSYTLKVAELPKYYKRLPIETFLTTKAQINDTLYIVESRAFEETQSEKLGIVKLENGMYKAIQYQGITQEIIQEFTVPASVFGVVINAEDRLKKPAYVICKPDVVSFFLGTKFYTILDTDCDVKTLDTIKSQLFLIQGNNN